jgi:ABC-type glycerol-3-phosphate transport system substrate-binding protein
MFRLCRVAYIACVLVLALFLMLSLSACQLFQQASKVTLRFAYPGQFSADPAVNQSLADRYKALAAAFHEQNPHITIKLVPQTWEQLPAITAKDFNVLLLQNTSYSGYINRGVLRSLAPWMSLVGKAWSDDYPPTVLKPFERNGELWAIPWALDPVILYYNKDLFSHYGVEPPKQGWTWSDFLEKADAITEAENGIYGAVILNGYALVPGIVYQHGGQLFDDWNQATRATFDNPRNAEALSWLASLIYEYKVMPTHAEVVRKYGSGMFAVATGINKGLFGMWTGQYIERGGASWGSDYTWKMAWGAAPLPRDMQAATIAGAYLLGISSQAADADASWQWLAFLSKQLPPDLLLPARTSQRQGMHPVDTSEQEALAAGSAALEGVLLLGSGASDNVSTANEALMKAVDAILQRNEPAEEQLQQAQQKATQ